MISRLGKIFNLIEYYSLIIALAVMVAVIFAQVVMRYVFNNSLSWSEEFARYLFVWFSWMGVSAGVKDNDHLKVDILAASLEKRGLVKSKEILNLIVFSIWLITTLIVAYYGIQIVQIQMRLNVVTPAMRLPVWIGYLSVPAFSGVVGIRLIVKMVESVKVLLSDKSNRLPVDKNEVKT